MLIAFVLQSNELTNLLNELVLLLFFFLFFHFVRSGKLKVPEWVDTVKLASHKELAPCDDNWFYTRVGELDGHHEQVHISNDGLCLSWCTS